MKPLKIVLLSAEISPYSKSGGLADVARSLPRSLFRLGHKVVVITPYYGCVKRKGWPLENMHQKLTLEFAGRSCKFGFKKIISPDNYPVIFVCQEELFGSRFGQQRRLYGPWYDNGLRFYLFDLAVIEIIKILKLRPDVLHCHDWHTGLIPNLLKMKYKDDPELARTSTLFTIHNLGFQGPKDWWKVHPDLADDGRGLPPEDPEKIEYVNFAKRAILHADIINTVSERYAREILTPEYGCQLDPYLRAREKDVYGIINGVDYTVFNPQFDENVYLNYDTDSLEKKVKNKVILQKNFGLEEDPDAPLIGLANRLTEQKGFELIINLLDWLLKIGFQVAIVGSGGGIYADFFRKMSRKNPKKLLFCSPFREEIARKIYAASDIYLMPSRWEPCGISQLISLRYGAIPVVHSVGGLSDTVSNYNPATGRGNGFVFTSYNSTDLLIAIVRALENYRRPGAWRKLVRRAMKESYSWRLPAKKYVALYRKAIRKHKKKS